MSDKLNHWNNLASALGAEVSVEPDTPTPAAPPVATEPPARPATPREPRPKPRPAAKSDWSKVAANLGLTPELAVEPAGDAGAFLDEVPDHDADSFAARAVAEDKIDVRPFEERPQAEPTESRRPRDETSRDRDRGRGRGRRGRHRRDESRDEDPPRRDRVATESNRDDESHPTASRPEAEAEASRRVHPGGRNPDRPEPLTREGEEAIRRPRDNETRDEESSEDRPRRGRRRRRRRGGERTPDSPSRAAHGPQRADALADDDELDAADPLADFADEHETRPARPPRDDEAHDDLGLPDDDDDDEEGVAAGLSHKNIPNWEEAIGIVIETNMAARSRSPQESSGRGQGRPSRGGRGGRSGRGGRGGRRN